MNKDPKYVTLEVTIGNAVAAETITPKVLPNPDKEYKYITGVWVEVATLPGGNTYVKAGVRDNIKGDRIDPAPSNLLNANSSVEPDKKFMPLRIKNDGRTITALVVNPVLTTDALGKVVFVFRLENIEERIANN